MVDIPPVSIAFKHEELRVLISILRDEVRTAEVNRHWNWAEYLRFLLLKLGDDPKDL